MNKRLIDTCNAKEALDQLAEFETNLVGAIVKESINEAKLKQVTDIGADPNMPNKEVHFRRGVIFANDSMFNMFATIRMSLENRIALETANATIDKKGKQ